MKKKSIITLLLATIIISSTTFFSFKVINAFTAREQIFQKTKILTDIIYLVKEEYVDEVDTEKLFDKAIAAVMDELDPHSVYVPPRNYENMSEEFMGFQGIGVQFRMIDEKVTIMRVLRNGPSEKAGLKLGDRIIAADGKNIIGLASDEIPPILKGPAGTRVKVTVDREGVADPIELEITRGQAFLESIKYFYMLNDEVGYINLDKFSKTSISELDWAIRKLEAQGMQKLVFDLRYNGGGLLPQAKEIADKFLKANKVIVETKGRTRSSNQVFISENRPDDFDKPVLVLVNEGSASASEIVSGALQDLDRAIIVGKTSFGKGLMQAQIPFADKSALLLTTGRWYTPLGRLIQKDYSDKSNSEYRHDAINDSLNHARELDEDRPSFETASGRVVYGGGGIKPDFEIKSTDLVSNYAARLNGAAEAPIFRYTQKLAVKNADKWNDVYDLIEDYKLDGTEMKSFTKFMFEIEYEFKQEDIDKYKDDIEKYLEANIAKFIWGDEGFKRALSTGDNVLDESLKYFKDAEELIKN